MLNALKNRDNVILTNKMLHSFTTKVQRNVHWQIFENALYLFLNKRQHKRRYSKFQRSKTNDNAELAPKNVKCVSN